MPTGQASLMPALRRVVLAGASTDRSDGQLLAAFIADRDADSFGLLVRRHGPMVLGVCRRVIGDRTTAEDAFQAVFLVLARRAPSVKPREQVGNWLYGVAYRTALKARAVLARRRSREKQVDVMPEPVARNSGGVASPGSPDWSDLQPVIDEELARLPEKLRGPVVLCDIEGRPQREVAKHLGVPPATLATRLATARRTLAQRLTKRGVTLSGGAVAGLLTAHGAASAVPHSITHGLTRAAEALATGEAVSSLVSASAVQLSEGVMRMMLLTKLKAIAVVALTALTLTGGIGLGLVPARADGPGDGAPAQQGKAVPVPTAAAQPPAKVIDEAIVKKWKEQSVTLNEKMDDLTFLRRLTLDVRGDMPTDIETFFFVADPDEKKRGKIVEWMLDDNGMERTYAAKVLGLPVERIRSVRMIAAKDDKPRALIVVVDASATPPKQIEALAFYADAKVLTVKVHDPKINLNRIEQGNGDTWTVVDGNTGQPHVVIRRQVQTDGKDKSVEVQGFFRAQTLPSTNEAKPIDATDALLFHTLPQNNNHLWATKDGVVGLWDANTGKALEGWLDGQPNALYLDTQINAVESDLDFLKKATMAARGTAPTALEERYFTEDKDPKKRERLLDSLLKEPAVAKKLGDDFKKKMLGTQPNFNWAVPAEQWKYFVMPDGQNPGGNFFYKVQPQPKQPKEPKQGGTFQFEIPVDPKTGQIKPGAPFHYEIHPQPQQGGTFQPEIPVDPRTGQIKPGGAPFLYEIHPQPPAPPAPPKPPTPPQPPAAPQVDKLTKLVGELLAAKKTDAEMLEAVTLATVGRLPTDTEKKLTLHLVATVNDRKAAWVAVAKALSGPSDGARKTEVLLRVKDANGLVVPVPPAKP